MRSDRCCTNTLPFRWSISCWTHTANRPSRQFDDFVLEVSGAHAHTGRALNLVVDTGNGKAALFVDRRLVAARDDFRIDEHAQVVLFFAGVDYDHALMNIDLSRGQTDPGRVVHGFGHVGHKLTNTIVNLRNGLGLFVQAWIGIVKNLKQSHVAERK